MQKSYSVNFPGEFGGGIINLTTKSAPKESFLSVGGSFGIDTETTGRLGYTYYGTKSDWTGFGNGVRRVRRCCRRSSTAATGSPIRAWTSRPSPAS